MKIVNVQYGWNARAGGTDRGKTPLAYLQDRYETGRYNPRPTPWPGLIDHAYRGTLEGEGERVWVSEPYGLGEEAMEDIAFLRRIGFIVDVDPAGLPPAHDRACSVVLIRRGGDAGDYWTLDMDEKFLDEFVARYGDRLEYDMFAPKWEGLLLDGKPVSTAFYGVGRAALDVSLVLWDCCLALRAAQKDERYDRVLKGIKGAKSARIYALLDGVQKRLLASGRVAGFNKLERGQG